jgi:hypothetical protein
MSIPGMKSMILASVLLAAIGTTMEFSWVPVASEPVRLAFWGITLLMFSSGLRSRLRSRQQSETA